MVSFLFTNAAQCATPKVGDKAPLVEGKNQDGKSWKLNETLGKKIVLLYFYPKDNTPGCTKEACGLRDRMADLKKDGVEVIGVSFDSADSHQKFIQKYSLPFTLLSDPDKDVMTKWGAYGEKMMYGKKVTGTIRSSVWIGPDGKVIKHWKRVPKAETHPASVLAELEGYEKG